MVTQPTDVPVDAFLERVTDAAMREDCDRLVELMSAQSGCEPVMWGPSIVGFGSYRYRYSSGQEGIWPLVGFSPRGREISLYLTTEPGPRSELLPELGKHRAGKSCVYIKRLKDIDEPILLKLIDETVDFARSLDVT